MRKAVLDTDVLSEILKGKDPTVVHFARAYRATFGRYTTSSVTIMEIVSGWRRRGDHDRLATFTGLIESFEVVNFDDKAARLAGEVHGELLKRGRTIGLADPMIAAAAMVNGLPLVTRNKSHFERIQELGHPLELEAWG